MVTAARPELHSGHKMEMGRSARHTEYHTPQLIRRVLTAQKQKKPARRGAVEGLRAEPEMANGETRGS